MNDNMTNVHPGAKIGRNVVISPFVTIAEHVEIGDDCWIGPNVTIFDYIRIGRGCKIFPGAVLGAIPQDLKFQGEETWAEIGDNTVVREFATVHRGTA
ncbi:MAG: acyl-[Bacteroidales bacterium]|nr:acyl-[acyl-carrier-protein]--UDP-N-acetylglucosamine O-acyltransferase [Bacteroidales bacterium]